ncbi:MAG: hypothetical protein Q8N05_16695 [Bacteroidota bacterium]|nr:hypothetical protein [Bacteroidota bacterium]
MKLINSFLDYIIKQRRLRQAAAARKKADELHLLDGKHYIVVFWNNRYMVMNNHDRKAINITMPKHQQLSFVELMRNKVYATK